jgi:hypothetical protein
MPAKTDRKALIEKIKALLSHTVDRGCTESEMAMALRYARKLMQDHDLTDDDINFGGETVARETVVQTDHDRIRNRLATPVGRFCHCVAYNDRSLFDALTFVGLQSETLFAHWMLDMLADFVMRRLEAHRVELRLRRLTRTERASFVEGCVARIAERLEELTPRPVASNGRDLVIARQGLIESYLREHGIKLREPFKLYRVDNRSYAAGQRAGNDAEFNRPIEQETSIKGLLT